MGARKIFNVIQHNGEFKTTFEIVDFGCELKPCEIFISLIPITLYEANLITDDLRKRCFLTER